MSGPMQGEREGGDGSTRCSGRASVLSHAAWHSSDVIVPAALRGGDVEGICPYAVGTGELAKGWSWTGPRGKRACASTPCAYTMQG
jgi:hypothetical protein